MLAFLKRILWDESAFERYARSVILFLGGLYLSHAIFTTPLDNKWHVDVDAVIGSMVLSAGGMIPAGQKNPKQNNGNGDTPKTD